MTTVKIGGTHAILRERGIHARWPWYVYNHVLQLDRHKSMELSFWLTFRLRAIIYSPILFVSARSTINYAGEFHCSTGAANASTSKNIHDFRALFF